MWIVSYMECPDYVHSSRKKKYLNKYLFLIFQWYMYGMKHLTGFWRKNVHNTG